MSMKWLGRFAAILLGGLLFCWPTFVSGQDANDPDCVVSQNGVCLDAVIRNVPPDAPAPKPAPVTFKKGRLTITAEGMSLRDILSAVGSQTGVDITLPQEGLDEKVAVHLGPASMRDVLVELLNGSSFNYVMLASPADPTVLQHLMLISRGATSGEAVIAATSSSGPAEAAGPALYGQGFSTEGESDNSEPDAAQAAQAAQDAEWASKQGQILDQMQKQHIKEMEQQQQQQQQGAPQPQ